MSLDCMTRNGAILPHETESSRPTSAGDDPLAPRLKKARCEPLPAISPGAADITALLRLSRFGRRLPVDGRSKPARRDADTLSRRACPRPRDPPPHWPSRTGWDAVTFF